MTYNVILTEKADEDIRKLKRSDPQSFKKFLKLIDELHLHPRTGTGQIEQLKYYQEETWSRRISSKHRLVYRIYDDVVEVLILAAYGHYNEK